MAAAMMAVAAAALATTAVAALTLRGDCSGRGIGEAESSKGGMVLHLQALGSGVGHDTVAEPTEESAGEGEGGDHRHHRGFDGRGCGLPSASSTLLSPTSTTTRTTTMTTTTMRTTTRAQF